jgi:hypothetical protein
VSPRRTVYTRLETAKLCHRSLRTIIRWEEEDGLLTPITNPADPTDRRVYYAAAEVEALLRRLRRLRGGPGGSDPPPGQTGGSPQGGLPQAPPARESSRPIVPRRRRPPVPRSPIPPRPGLAKAVPRSTPKPVVPPYDPPPRSSRDPAAGAPRSSPKPLLPTSRAPLPDDAEANKWLSEIDSRKRAWEDAQANTTGDTGEARDEGESPPSSAARSRR